jgi:hypothetical protein
MKFTLPFMSILILMILPSRILSADLGGQSSRVSCLSLNPVDALSVEETNGCNALVQFTVEWTNGGSIVNGGVYHACKSGHYRRTIQRRAPDFRIVSQEDVTQLFNATGGPLIGYISLDHESEGVYGLTNNSDSTAFVLAKNANPPLQMYCAVIGPHRQARHIAGYPIVPTYAIGDPD